MLTSAVMGGQKEWLYHLLVFTVQHSIPKPLILSYRNVKYCIVILVNNPINLGLLTKPFVGTTFPSSFGYKFLQILKNSKEVPVVRET